jgi:hypothetical protein
MTLPSQAGHPRIFDKKLNAGCIIVYQCAAQFCLFFFYALPCPLMGESLTGGLRIPLLETLLDAGYVPIIAPVSLGLLERSDIDTNLLNVNGDTAAGEIAAALRRGGIHVGNRRHVDRQQH